MTQESKTRISRALVQNPRYLEDFGRVEADVLLQFEGQRSDSAGVKVVTSVPLRRNERFESLYIRLTRDAARLWRLLESKNLPQASNDFTQAA